MAMHIGHVAIQVSDLERSVDHAIEVLGLTETERGNGQSFLTANAKRYELQFIESAEVGLSHVGLELEDESEIAALRDRVIAHGGQMISEVPRETGIESAIRFVGPGGIVFEAYARMTREPLSLENTFAPLARRLGHLTFTMADKAEFEEFLVGALGFRVSDRWGEQITWLRCDVDHHGLAVAQSSSGARLHHYAYELAGWDAMRQYADHLAVRGHKLVWGPGRHGPGANIFAYLLDPAGLIVETYCDMLRIVDDAAYTPMSWKGEPWEMNLWGHLEPDNWGELGIPVLTPNKRSASAH